jgi:hypothetical protein
MPLTKRQQQKAAEAYWQFIFAHVATTKFCRNEDHPPQIFLDYVTELKLCKHKKMQYEVYDDRCSQCDVYLHCECPLRHDKQRYFLFHNMVQHLKHCKAFKQAENEVWDYLQGRREHMPQLFEMKKITVETQTTKVLQTDVEVTLHNSTHSCILTIQGRGRWC